MKTLSSLLVIAGLSLAACSQGSKQAPSPTGRDPDACPSQGAHAVSGTQRYVFSEAEGARSRVARTVGADGAETLHGETDLPLLGAQVTEYVEIDPAGRLVYADVIFTQVRPGETVRTVKRLIADAQHGTVHIRRGGDAAFWQVPADAPWAYAVWTGAQGLSDVPVVTPVAAWVTFRGAAASAWVRMIDGEKGFSHVVPADQLVISGDGDHAIVLGDRVVSASDDFVVALGPGVESVRMTQKEAGLGGRRGLSVRRVGAL